MSQAGAAVQNYFAYKRGRPEKVSRTRKSLIGESSIVQKDVIPSKNISQCDYADLKGLPNDLDVKKYKLRSTSKITVEDALYRHPLQINEDILCEVQNSQELDPNDVEVSTVAKQNSGISSSEGPIYTLESSIEKHVSSNTVDGTDKKQVHFKPKLSKSIRVDSIPRPRSRSVTSKACSTAAKKWPDSHRVKLPSKQYARRSSNHASRSKLKQLSSKSKQPAKKPEEKSSLSEKIIDKQSLEDENLCTNDHSYDAPRIGICEDMNISSLISEDLVITEDNTDSVWNAISDREKLPSIDQASPSSSAMHILSTSSTTPTPSTSSSISSSESRSTVMSRRPESYNKLESSQPLSNYDFSKITFMKEDTDLINVHRWGYVQSGNILGEGTYGKVYKMQNAETQEIRAFKRSFVNASTGLPSWLYREVSLLNSLEHPYIIDLIEVFIGPGRVYLSFPYVNGGNLMEFTQRFYPKGMPLSLIRLIAQQLLAAVANCHRQRIIHRDLKPENILCVLEEEEQNLGLNNKISASLQGKENNSIDFYSVSESLAFEEESHRFGSDVERGLKFSQEGDECYIGRGNHSSLSYMETDLAKNIEYDSSTLRNVSNFDAMNSEPPSDLKTEDSKDSAGRLAAKKQITLKRILLADFGLARSIRQQNQQGLTPEVITLNYRPIELLLGMSDYSSAVDIWSIGCILLELFVGPKSFRRAFFGEECITEFGVTIRLLQRFGRPSKESWPRLYSLPFASTVLPNIVVSDGDTLTDIFVLRPDAEEPFKNLIKRMLHLNPEDRITAARALRHQWLL